MSRIPLVEHQAATGRVRSQLDQIHDAFGTVPAMFRAVANSPAALSSMWAAFGAYGAGALGPAISEQIAHGQAATLGAGATEHPDPDAVEQIMSRCHGVAFLDRRSPLRVAQAKPAVPGSPTQAWSGIDGPWTRVMIDPHLLEP